MTTNKDARRVADLTIASLGKIVRAAMKAELSDHFMDVATVVTTEVERIFYYVDSAVKRSLETYLDQLRLLHSNGRHEPKGLVATAVTLGTAKKHAESWAHVAAHLDRTLVEMLRAMGASTSAADIVRTLREYSNDSLNDLLWNNYSAEELDAIRMAVYRRLDFSDACVRETLDAAVLSSSDQAVYVATFGAEFSRALAHHRCSCLTSELNASHDDCLRREQDGVRWAENEAHDVAVLAVEASRVRRRDAAREATSSWARIGETCLGARP